MKRLVIVIFSVSLFLFLFFAKWPEKRPFTINKQISKIESVQKSAKLLEKNTEHNNPSNSSVELTQSQIRMKAAGLSWEKTNPITVQ